MVTQCHVRMVMCSELKLPSRKLFQKMLLTFGRVLLPLPHRCKVCLALWTFECVRWGWGLLVLGDVVYNVLQSKQVDELRVWRVWDEVHLWWGWFRGRDLKHHKLQCWVRALSSATKAQCTCNVCYWPAKGFSPAVCAMPILQQPDAVLVSVSLPHVPAPAVIPTSQMK